MPYLQEIGLSPRVLTFAALVALTTGVHLLSFARAAHFPLRFARKVSPKVPVDHPGTVWRRFGANLVVVELSMAVVLLVGASLLGQEFLPSAPRRHRPLSRTISPPCKSQPSAIPISEGRATDQSSHASSGRGFRALPGVNSVAFTSRLPLGDGDGTTGFRIVGRPYHGEHNEVAYRAVSAELIPSTLQARLMRGRYFADEEDVIQALRGHSYQSVNWQSNIFLEEDPVGKQISMGTEGRRAHIGDYSVW